MASLMPTLSKGTLLAACGRAKAADVDISVSAAQRKMAAVAAALRREGLLH